MRRDHNKALVRRFVRDVLGEGRAESLDELVADDFVSHTWGPSGSGKEDLERAWRGWPAAWPMPYFTIEDLIAEDDHVAARLTVSAMHVEESMGLPASGRLDAVGEIHVFRIADGRIVEHWHQYDQAGMLRKLGTEGPEGGRGTTLEEDG